MNQWFYYIISFIIAYLAGSCNASIIVSKMIGGDIRNHGSGNAGLTNTYRTYGASMAIFVLLIDLLKGVFAVGMAWLICYNMHEFKYASYCCAAVGVILGHCFPVFFKFRGGKGVLTTFSVVLLLNWRVGLACFFVFLIIVLITRYVSLGSCTAALLLVPFTLILPPFRSQNASIFYFEIFVSLLVVIMHRANIKRLINGTENQFSLHKKG